MELIPIKESIAENEAFTNDPLCQETIYMCIDFYKKIGYSPPWICYYASENGEIMGSAGFKGCPVNSSVEIAYATFEMFRQKGIGSRICKKLVELSLKTDPSIKITARTLPEKNYSTRILEKNNFIFTGPIHDPEDGTVWEWVYNS